MEREIITTTDFSWGRCKLSEEGGGGPGGGGPTGCKATGAYCKVHRKDSNMGECCCPLDEDGEVTLVYKKEIVSEEEQKRRDKLYKRRK